jgi:hypothetical protein
VSFGAIFGDTRIWLLIVCIPTLLSCLCSQDCSAIPSATRATCSQASCHVAACQPGFVISKDKKSCVERSHKGGPDDELMDEAWEEEERLLEESDKQKVIGRKSSWR